MKTVELIVCFSNKTWEYCEEQIGDGIHFRKDKEEVESFLLPRIEIKYLNSDKSIVAITLIWWGEE